MFYREFVLAPQLRCAALCAWRFELEPGDPPFLTHMVPPDGTTNLVLAAGPDGTCLRYLVGPSLVAAPVPVAQGWSFAGLRLRPEATQSVTGDAPATLVGKVEETGGNFALFDALERLVHWPHGAQAEPIQACLAPIETDRAIAGAVDALISTGGAIAIRELAAQAELGPRQFRRRFVAATGLSPKQYASVQRVRRAMILSLDQPNWADVASAAGFADQAHLSRAVRSSFGTAPRRIGGYIGGIRHDFVTGDPFVQDSGGLSD